MKWLIAVGLVLVAVGVIGIVVRTDVVPDEDRARLGPVEVAVQHQRQSEWPMYAGIASAAVGVVLIIIGAFGAKSRA